MIKIITEEGKLSALFNNSISLLLCNDLGHLIQRIHAKYYGYYPKEELTLYNNQITMKSNFFGKNLSGTLSPYIVKPKR